MKQKSNAPVDVSTVFRNFRRGINRQGVIVNRGAYVGKSPNMTRILGCPE